MLKTKATQQIHCMQGVFTILDTPSPLVSGLSGWKIRLGEPENPILEISIFAGLCFLGQTRKFWFYWISGNRIFIPANVYPAQGFVDPDSWFRPFCSCDGSGAWYRRPARSANPSPWNNIFLHLWDKKTTFRQKSARNGTKKQTNFFFF